MKDVFTIVLSIYVQTNTKKSKKDFLLNVFEIKLHLIQMFFQYFIFQIQYFLNFYLKNLVTL